MQPWSNHALLLLKGFLQSAAAPKWTDTIEMTPVDLVSQAIVKLSLNTHESKTRTFNIHNSAALPWIEYIQKVADILEHKVELLDADHWRTQVLPLVERNNPLILFKDFYSIKESKFSYLCPQDDVTDSMLRQVGVFYPSKADYESLIKIYLDFLIRVKFINISS
jgi:hypothetical protein